MSLVTHSESQQIMFVNTLPKFYSSIYSMGLFYTKKSEGSV